MANAPRWKVYSPDGEYLASCHYPEDAAVLVAANGPGSTIRRGHARKLTVWKEGGEEFSAAESYDRVAEVCERRRQEFVAATNAKRGEAA